MRFFDRPASVTRFRMVHALWRRQRVGMLPGVAPVALRWRGPTTPRWG